MENYQFTVVHKSGEKPRLTIRNDGSVTLKVPLGEDREHLEHFARYVRSQVGIPSKTLRSAIGTHQGLYSVKLDKWYDEEDKFAFGRILKGES